MDDDRATIVSRSELYESKSASDTSVRDQRTISIADPIFILDMQSVVSRFHKQVRGGTTRIKESRPRKTLINLARRCKWPVRHERRARSTFPLGSIRAQRPIKIADDCVKVRSIAPRERAVQTGASPLPSDRNALLAPRSFPSLV